MVSRLGRLGTLTTQGVLGRKGLLGMGILCIGILCIGILCIGILCIVYTMYSIY